MREEGRGTAMSLSERDEVGFSLFSGGWDRVKFFP